MFARIDTTTTIIKTYIDTCPNCVRNLALYTESKDSAFPNHTITMIDCSACGFYDFEIKEDK